jgi:hypothetical protein
MNKGEPILCPSYRCEEGAILVGIVNAEGHIVFASNRLVVDQDFVDTAQHGRTPEKRFRFSGPCAQGSCQQWTGNRCGVIDRVLIQAVDLASTTLPNCSIRSQCRWFHQSGAEACAVCPEVITDLRHAATNDGLVVIPPA